jgi:hypothetical protein
MKKSVLLIAIISLAAVACSTQKQVSSAAGDDVYGSPNKSEQSVAGTTKPQTSGAQVITSPDNATVQKSNSSSFADDYNDYSYSSRINRFSSKDTTKGYFDDAYSEGSSYTNTGNDSPDVNVYLGYGAGYGGFYSPSFYMGSGWGYPYSGWGWDYGWGYPYYGWGYNYGWGWGNPYHGWYDPWYNPCCYCYGYNDWYNDGYPHYSNTGNYYGSRTSLYRTDGGRGSLNSRSSVNPSAGNTGQISRSAGNPVYSRSDGQPSVRSVPANQEKYRYTQRTSNQQTINQRSAGRGQARNLNNTQRQQPAPRYVRPENTTPAQRSGSVQSYSSPVYRQPKSSQEYLGSQSSGTARSSDQQTGNRYNSGNSGQNTRQNATPSNNRTYSTPARSNPSNYSAPSRSNSNYTTPSSTPSRSGNSGSYSAPSRGSGSYSTPSRSGGNSGSSPSGSGSSSGSGKRR